jgi:hypothetical protein
MPTATITLDAALMDRVAKMAAQTGQSANQFVEALLRRLTESDIRFDQGVPMFPPRPGAPTITVEDVNRMLYGDEG